MERNEEREKELKDKYYPHTLTNIEVYDTEHAGVPYQIARFRHKNAWEVHFHRTDSEHPYDRTNTNKGSGSSKLISSAIKLYKEKLDRGQPIRYYGSDEGLEKMYDSSFKYVSKKHHDGNLYSKKVDRFKSPSGEEFSATEIHTRDPERKSAIGLSEQESTYKKMQ